MIIIKIKGGLGNQFFQYAFGRAASIRLNTELAFDLSNKNIYEIKKNIAREYKLDKFNIQARVANSTEIAAIKTPLLLIIKKTWRKLTFYNYDTFDKNFLNIKNNTYLEGFWWQNEKYFIGSNDLIKQELTLKEHLSPYGHSIKDRLEKFKQSGNKLILIHVRRGDYINDPKTLKHHGVLGLTYYQKAILTLKAKLLDQHLKYILVSDDIEWTKENIGKSLPPDQWEILSNPTSLPDYEEMMLMTLCDHFIIANSSFSWWAAWLGEKPESIIIAPSRWTNQSEFPNSPVPERWNIIKN